MMLFGFLGIANTVVYAQYDNYPYAIIELDGLGGFYTITRAINNQGWITGECSNTEHRYRAGLWEKDTLILHDLGSLDGDNSVGYDINDRGQVVGYAQRTSEYDDYSAYLMTPAYPSFDLAPAEPGIAGVVNTMTASNLQPGAKVHFVYNRYGGGSNTRL